MRIKNMTQQQHILNTTKNRSKSKLFGSRIVHHSNVIWKGHIYTDPKLKPYNNHYVRVTELQNGQSLLITDRLSNLICTAKHITQAYAVEHIEYAPLVRHGLACISKPNSFVIDDDSSIIKTHPNLTKIIGSKSVFKCTYTTTLIKENNITQAYAHWVAEEK